MGEEEAAVAIITILMGGATIITVARLFFKHLGAKSSAPPPPPAIAASVDDRLSRIEQAVDAIAIEVERMSEGQRFTTRLLAERLHDGAAVPAARPGPGGSSDHRDR